VAASSWALNLLPSSTTQNVTATEATVPRKPPKATAEKKSAPPKKQPVPAAAATSEAKDDGPDDSRTECVSWAASGECEKNPGYMRDACARSCAGKLPAAASTQTQKPAEQKKDVRSMPVDWSRPTLSGELAAAQAEAEARSTPMLLGRGMGCADKRADCAELARWNLSACGEAEFMLRECSKTCRTCSHGELVGGLMECADSHDSCAMWAKAGECEANRRFMLSGCSKSCNVCEEKRLGCMRRNPTPGVVSPDGMPSMFERALRDFPQFEPVALSTSPYVLQFDNIVNAEEAAAFIRLAGSKLERSLAGDQISPVRTSTQFWCDDSDGCTSDPTMLKVTARMMNISNLPVDHAEYFQILRYEPGQFYKQHHDQQTAHWTPQGVRVYTFLVYLSDVEEGGGTKFNDLDLVVKPKLGRAVLWPSVLATDLLTGEPKTHHEALPVEKGVKFACNLWIHLYDFKTPSRAGICPFLGQNTHGGA